MHPAFSRQGFTIFEMAIVVAIIGLVAGGIFLGKDLMRAAEIRKLASQVDEIKSMAATFRGKYTCIPGDCLKATRFFGDDPQGCSELTLNKTPKTQTCNGNGDGIISRNGLENNFFAQHLSAAGMLTDLYRGGRITGDYDDKTTILQILNMDDMGWFLDVSDEDMSLENGITIPTAQVLYMGKFVSDGIEDGFFTPQEALVFDQKYDDGKAGYGTIQAQSGAQIVDCTNPDNSVTAQYKTTVTTKTCNLLFAVKF